MRTLVVVAVPPVFGHAADLIEILEDITVEDFGPEGLIESLDVGVLGRLARLDMDERDAVPGGEVGCSRDERPLRAQTLIQQKH